MTIRRSLLLAAAVLCFATAAVIKFWSGTMHGLGVLPRVPSATYNWWSGSGSVILPPFITLVGLGLLMWWHHTCHETDCLRYGRFTTDEENGHHFLRCSKHHTIRHN